MTQVTKTNWCIITGGPSTGKSKLVDALAFEGFRIVPEAARILIDEKLSQGQCLQDIRGNEEDFQLETLGMKIRAENAADPKLLTFWERGIPDSIAYLEHVRAESKTAFEASLLRRYKMVFLLDPLPLFEHDYARVENEVEARVIHKALNDVYQRLGYSVIKVPVLPISGRVEMIRKHTCA